MNLEKSAQLSIVYRISLLSLVFQTAFCQLPANSTDRDISTKEDQNPARIESARQIIKSSEEYKSWAKKFIAQAKKETAEAHKLTGEAKVFRSKLPPPKMKALRGAQLAEAKKQFSLDLSRFAQHAKQYRQHTERVRKQFGECEASRKAYERNQEKLGLHCQAFHLPNVAPPHICLAMDLSAGEAASIKAEVQEQYKRMADAAAELNKSEERLGKALAASPTIDADVRKQHALNLQEQELVAEFGRLKEEHRQLDVARKALQSSGVKVGVSSVSAKVKK